MIAQPRIFSDGTSTRAPVSARMRRKAASVGVSGSLSDRRQSVAEVERALHGIGDPGKSLACWRKGRRDHRKRAGYNDAPPVNGEVLESAPD